ncbi:class I SAM-dependent methyltransferase [uncultured Desulfobacter sp.]|uniref:class I SAM-dependent methyltransferase n=1 Tax=uncultured Desulfobacter sp. TaxID=240139 RepID=UPI0029F46D2F|nr:class I SAM-dependent methyltransferase [uncultured Desulfobacter sp.]
MNQITYWNRESLNKRRNYAHPVIETFTTSKLRMINQLVDLNGKQCLELGAGNGFFSYYLDRICKLIATDYSKKMLSLNPARNKQLMDASAISFPDDSFDVVFESCMLHHADNIHSVIKEMVRVAKEYVIIIEPNRNNPFVFLFGLFNKEERGLLKFSQKFIAEILRKHDLINVTTFSHGVIMPNKTPLFLLSLSKILDRKLPFLGLDNIFIYMKR